MSETDQPWSVDWLYAITLLMLVLIYHSIPPVHTNKIEDQANQSLDLC
jgi:hypothetical protein